MKKEQIAMIAYEPTKSHNRTTIYFKDESFIVGFFENNTRMSKEYNDNDWFFVKFPIEINSYRHIKISGDTIEKIILT